jgi:predicted permease
MEDNDNQVYYIDGLDTITPIDLPLLDPSGQMLLSTFNTSLLAVLSVLMMAASGIYLHRRGYLGDDNGGITVLSRFAQQLTLPAFFFSRIVACPVSSSTSPGENIVCPNILVDHWNEASGLLLWPCFVVACGLAIGKIITHIVKVPRWQKNAVLVAIAFGNSSGLPLTLISAIEGQTQQQHPFPHVDPTLFLSIYSILNPVLLWGIGGWLLKQDTSFDHCPVHDKSDIDDSAVFGATENKVNPKSRNSTLANHNFRKFSSLNVHDVMNSTTSDEVQTNDNVEANHNEEEVGLLSPDFSPSITARAFNPKDSSWLTTLAQLLSRFWDQLGMARGIMKEMVQPPSVGSLLGIVVASCDPLRSLFVQTHSLSNHLESATGRLPYLGWLFAAITTVGNASIPLNMAILGANLSIAQLSWKSRQILVQHENMNRQAGTKDLENEGRINCSDQRDQPGFVDISTIVSVVLGKMILMPAVGIVTTYLLRTFFWSESSTPEIWYGLSLVHMIVFCMPTANNVMVMADLAACKESNLPGSLPNQNMRFNQQKEMMALLIGWQYLLSPILLSISVTVLISIAAAS